MDFENKRDAIKKIAKFNYYFMHNKIPHRKNLWKWNIVNTPTCEECNVIDNCEHFIFSCKSIKYFWKNIVEVLNIIYNSKIQLMWKHIIFGYMINYEKFDIMNLILCTASFAVYKAKVLKQRHVECFLKEELIYINYGMKNKIIREFVKQV